MKSLKENQITTWHLASLTPQERVNFFLCKNELGGNLPLAPLPKILAITRYLKESGIFDVKIPKPGDLTNPVTPPEIPDPVSDSSPTNETLPVNTQPPNSLMDWEDEEKGPPLPLDK